MFLVFFLYFLYATIFVIGKFAIQVSQPIFLTGIRMICAGILSYGIHWVWYKDIEFPKLHRADWGVIVLLALFNVYITNAGEFWSLQYLSAGKTSFIYNISPFFVLLFSVFLFAESVTVKKIIGMVIGFISLMPMLMGQEGPADTTARFGFLSVAELIMLCSSAATALGWVLMRHFIHKNFTPYFLNGISLTLGGLMCLLHAYAFEPRPFVLAGSIQEFLWYMLIMMFIQNIVAYNLHAHLLHSYTATLIALISFIMPLMTVVMGAMFLSEQITAKFFICSAGVALGLFVFYQEELKLKYL